MNKIFFIEKCYFYSYIALYFIECILNLCQSLFITKIIKWKKSSNLVLFVDEKFNILTLKKHILASEYSFISDLLKVKSLKKSIINFDINSKKKIILIAIKKNITSYGAENLGAKFYDEFKDIKQNIFNVNSDTLASQYKNIIGHFLHGIKLKSYKFEKYKTKKKQILV